MMETIKESSTDRNSPSTSNNLDQPPTLLFENIVKTFEGEVALDSVSLRVNPGELHGVIGADGAGKSTLLAIAAGVMRENSGRVEILGNSALKMREHVGYVPQNLALFDDLTVEENIDYQAGLNLVEPEVLENMKEKLLTEFTLSSFKDRPAGKLSGGMKQKLALCLALVNKPDIVVLDEPTTGLDPRARREMWWHLRTIAKRGVSVLVATPNLEEASLLDRLLFIHCGKALMTGSPEVITRENGGDLTTFFRNELQKHGEKVLSPSNFPGFKPDTTGKVAVRTRALKKRFGKFEAVAGLDLEVRYGEVFGLLGANGAGKTTSVKMICGLIKSSEGEIILGGEDAGKRRSLGLRKRIGYMSQKITLYDRLRVKENLEFYATVYEIPHKLKKSQIDWAIAACGLEDILMKPVGKLPPGLKQRVSFAASIMHDPEIIFLDEPTAGVDPLAREQLWNLTEELKTSGKAILVTTHYMDEAGRCDRLALMRAGEIKVSGNPEEIRNSVKENVSVMEGSRQQISKAEEILKDRSENVISLQREQGKLLIVHERETRSALETILNDHSDLNFKLRQREASLDDAFIIYTDIKEKRRIEEN